MLFRSTIDSYSTKIKNQLGALNAMRLSVLNKKIIKSAYNLYVKYPAGYEG